MYVMLTLLHSLGAMELYLIYLLHQSFGHEHLTGIEWCFVFMYINIVERETSYNYIFQQYIILGSCYFIKFCLHLPSSVNVFSIINFGSGGMLMELPLYTNNKKVNVWLARYIVIVRSLQNDMSEIRLCACDFISNPSKL